MIPSQVDCVQNGLDNFNFSNLSGEDKKKLIEIIKDHSGSVSRERAEKMKNFL
jgi:hypothetical protein